MKLIPQDEIDKAALKYANKHAAADDGDYFTKKEFIEFAKIDFKAGVEFAESKFEELAIEFAKYILSSTITRAKSPINSETYYQPEFKLLKGELIANGEKLFQQFIKDRDAKD